MRIRLEEGEELVISISGGAVLSATIKKKTMLDDGVIYVSNIDLLDEEKLNFDSELDIDFLKKLVIDMTYYLKIEGLKRVLAPKMKIISATWKDVVDAAYMKMNWAFVDQRQHRKLEMEEQTKKIKIE
ncbi:hypothetical protein CASFOL_041329 [Castilleja foliolosa]|uniref:Uncharacterized protein n=1 Tax=Castilleja foliolosa TaxID=1961234 RepID=A0ABD3BE37_9LAMI